MLVDVLGGETCRTLAFTQYLTHHLIVLLKSLDIGLDFSDTVFEIINLIIQNLVMFVNGNFSIYKCIDTGRHSSEVLFVQRVHLLHQHLGNSGSTTLVLVGVGLLVTLSLLFELLLLHLLCSCPSALTHCGSDLLLNWRRARLDQLLAGLDHVNQGIVRVPLLVIIRFHLHVLVVHVGDLLEHGRCELHVHVYLWWLLWIRRWNNDLHRVRLHLSDLEMSFEHK